MSGDFPDDWFRPARPDPTPAPQPTDAEQERWTDQFKPNYLPPDPDVTAPTRPLHRRSPGTAASPASPIPSPNLGVEHSVGTARTAEVLELPPERPRGLTRTVLPLVGAFVLALGTGLAIGRHWGRPTTDSQNAGPQMPVAASTPGAQTSHDAQEGPWVGAVSPVKADGVKASCIAASQPGYDGNLVPSDAERVLDGDQTTGWRCEGKGTGQTLTFSFPEGTKVVGVRMTNGYTKKVDGSDLYPQYRRLSRVTWSLPSMSGAYFVQELSVDDQRLQEIRIPEVDAKGGLTMRIDATTKPGRSTASRNAVIVTEVEFLTRAG
ncbi:hypothetical protein AAEX63_02480 [Luteococcus sp. H138]|uniref:NADase-type glycan-binding domain-containing protein n=1 Tax=unclassified Luteococcus TaxID=2639923 RepID=UPI00313D830D